MVKRLAKDGSQILQELTPQKVHLWHMATGICGEAGEILDSIKKHVAYSQQLNSINAEGQSLVTNLIEELGDIEFYLEGLRQALSIERSETLVANKRKLFHRYPGFEYSNHAAQERKDKV